MIKDRGNIKWTSLMLTEHRKKLEEIWDHDQYIEKPILDEQQLEMLDYKIKEAIKNKNKIKLVYYQDNKIKELSGKLIMNANNIYIDNKKIYKGNILDIIK